MDDESLDGHGLHCMRGDANSGMADAGCGAEQDHALLCGERRRLCHSFSRRAAASIIAISVCPSPLRPRASRLERQGDQFLIACGGSKTVSVTVQTPSADRSCGDAGTVGVEIYSISADGTRGVAVAIFVCGYAFVANRTRRPAVAVAISADVLTADPACRIAVLISVGVYGAIAVSACRITRSIRVQGAALGVQRQSGYRQRQGCKNEARHRTPPLL